MHRNQFLIVKKQQFFFIFCIVPLGRTQKHSSHTGNPGKSWGIFHGRYYRFQKGGILWYNKTAAAGSCRFRLDAPHPGSGVLSEEKGETI